MDRAKGAGAMAALLWWLLCLRWFDVAEPWRPGAVAAVPPLVWLAATALATGAWLWWRRGTLWGPPARLSGAMPLVLALAFFVRLPIAVGGAGAAVTSDGALSGIVALHVLDGSERLVFVPHVPYSGSLKSHLTAPLAAVIDPARAFALVSVLFYLVYVAAIVRLALLVSGRRAALLAGLYAAFSPAFLTRYSLSNDGNYVEVLALGTWALWLAARWTREHASRPQLAFAAGLLLGLGFWCHILAVIYLAAIALLFALAGRFASLRSLLSLAAGWAIGYAPGWLWNLANGWESFGYLLPGVARTRGGVTGVAVMTTGLAEKVWLMLTDHGPALMGYDPGYGPALDRALLALAWLGVFAALIAVGHAARRVMREGLRTAPRHGEGGWPLAALLIFTVTNIGIALLALPHVPGNPRYILFLMSVIPVFLADAFGTGPLWPRRFLLSVLIATGAVASIAQVPPTLEQDARWRGFVSELERAGVRHCYTDFFLATRINFLSSERVVCSAKLGPFTTEYFFAYREAVERAPEAALIPVNRTAASRLEKRLTELGVAYERRDLLKPVLLRLSRKVDPKEIFPWRDLPPR